MVVHVCNSDFLQKIIEISFFAKECLKKLSGTIRERKEIVKGN